MQTEGKKKTVYIAGKITGDPFYKSKFYDAQHELEKAGFTVVNPAMLPADAFTHEAYMRMTKPMLDECEAVCFLPDWTESEGAIYEHGRAIRNQQEIFYLRDIADDTEGAEPKAQNAEKCTAKEILIMACGSEAITKENIERIQVAFTGK